MNRFLCQPDALVLNSSTAYQFFEFLGHTSIWVLPIIAIITNSLILLVILTTPRLNRSSFSVYVKSMAISDTLVLVFKYLSFENKTSKLFYWPSMCTILVFLGDSSVLISVWTVALITVERALIVIFPIHFKKFVSVYRARILILLVTIISLVSSARVLLIRVDTSPGQYKRCHPLPTWQNYRQLNASINDFILCFIPLSIVIIGNCITLYAIKQALFQRKKILASNIYHQNKQFDTNENQLMLMLLFVTLMFTVYFLPFTITNIISRWGLPFGLCFTNTMFKNYLILRSVFELLKDLNFCTNFIIYCISGRQFRYAFFALIHCRRMQFISTILASKSSKPKTEPLLELNIPKPENFDLNPTYDEAQV